MRSPGADAVARTRPHVVPDPEDDVLPHVVVPVGELGVEGRADLVVGERRRALTRQEMRELHGVGGAEPEHAIRPYSPAGKRYDFGTVGFCPVGPYQSAI